MTTCTITAVILAGGKARRLGGCDKGLVALKGKPLVEYILPLLQSCFDEIVINANRNQQQYARYGVSVVGDQLDDFQGPLAGILAAMEQVNTSHILVLPCDTPLINKVIIDRFIEALDVDGSGNDIMVAFDGRREQFLHALIPVALQESLADFLSRGERSVGFWYKEHCVHHIDFSDCPELFDNINTPSDLASIV